MPTETNDAGKRIDRVRSTLCRALAVDTDLTFPSLEDLVDAVCAQLCTSSTAAKIADPPEKHWTKLSTATDCPDDVPREGLIDHTCCLLSGRLQGMQEAQQETRDALGRVARLEKMLLDAEAYVGRLTIGAQS